MTHNPNICLLYEHVDKVPYTVRMKVHLNAPADAALLTKATQEAIGQRPYVSVQVGLVTGGELFFFPNADALPNDDLKEP